MHEEDLELLARRMDELARRASDTGFPCFSTFLSPAEAELAQRSANRAGIRVFFAGGWEFAERTVACFGEEEPSQEEYPIAALHAEWPRQKAPAHRDLLGSVMGLGLKRSCVGDIVLREEDAYLFCEKRVAPVLSQSLTSAGKVSLRVEIASSVPPLTQTEGTELRETVAALRLDAILAAGLHLSRSSAAELISSGLVKLRHIPNERPDARVCEGDAVSVRGYGRLVLAEVGYPTRKDRLPVRLIRYGEPRKH
jgi:Uncharacterized conserved protein, contains S4-like domain